MKTQTQKLVTTQKGQFSKVYAYALAACRFDQNQNRIYTGYYNGSGKWATRASAQWRIIEILNAQGYKYTTGNDAPKGGITGEYVQLSAVAFRFMLNLRNS